jgi:hypothetical protein
MCGNVGHHKMALYGGAGSIGMLPRGEEQGRRPLVHDLGQLRAGDAGCAAPDVYQDRPSLGRRQRHIEGISNSPLISLSLSADVITTSFELGHAPGAAVWKFPGCWQSQRGRILRLARGMTLRGRRSRPRPDRFGGSAIRPESGSPALPAQRRQRPPDDRRCPRRRRSRARCLRRRRLFRWKTD